MRTNAQEFDAAFAKLVDLLKERGDYSVEITVRCDGRVDFSFVPASYSLRGHGAIHTDLHPDILPRPSSVLTRTESR